MIVLKAIMNILGRNKSTNISYDIHNTHTYYSLPNILIRIRFRLMNSIDTYLRLKIFWVWWEF